MIKCGARLLLALHRGHGQVPAAPLPRLPEQVRPPRRRAPAVPLTQRSDSLGFNSRLHSLQRALSLIAESSIRKNIKLEQESSSLCWPRL